MGAPPGISSDADQLEATFAEWLLIAEKARRDFEDRLFFPEKVLIDVEELLAWCRQRKLPVNGEARSQYVTWLLRERDKQADR